MWAGFTILTSTGDEEKVKKAKNIIVYALIGLLLIFLAFSITRFILGTGKDKKEGIINAISNAFTIDGAYAASVDDGKGFDYYRAQIEATSQAIGRDYDVDGRVKIASLQDLQTAVTKSIDTFPDGNRDLNTGLANSVLTSIALVKKYPDSNLYTDRLAQSLKDFLTRVAIGQITTKITATPDRGNAALTVTLRANEARDPSGVRIPDANYIWWLKNAGGIRQVIGKGPTIGYKFSEEGVYTVNLQILSASKNSNGRTDVLPFNGTQEIRVEPKLANILLFLNGANVSQLDNYKITPAQGSAGVIIDATSSTAAQGASILRTEWIFGNGNNSVYNGSPRVERQVFATQGIYTIQLKVVTNEKAEIIKTIRLQVQDPIASIRTDKTTGFAGDDFKFQATSNAAGVLLTYDWSILESDTGKILYTTKASSINYKFPRMGNYVVKLKTLSSSGREDTDNVSIHIDSKDPIVQFEVKAASAETPNMILLDATKSYDPDSLDASKLTFNWTIDGERVDLDNSSRNGALGYYTFTTKGTHNIVLDLGNQQGKVTNGKKEFNVESLLSVKLIVTPKISQLGAPVALVAESKEATVFEWDYGDGSSENTSESRAFHTYKKAGTYDVRLTVRGNPNAGNSNTISRKVYVSDADSPFASISVKQGQDSVEPVSGICSEGDAYLVDRTNAVRITGEESVNTDGTTNGLTYTWKYGGKTSTQRDFSYKFDELGCFPVNLTVRSQKTGKTHSSSVYVKVENVLPTFASLSVVANKIDTDPVVVDVAVNNATDADGVIVSYLWYYYTDSDPEPQDFRITRTSKTVFVLPRINGKYYFAVTLEDSNGAKVNSDDSREERYSLTLASDNINTPLISLKSSKSSASVGESVSFQASVKNILQQDLTDKAEYKWDYDGDGFYEETTTSPSVKHTYDKPGSYNMKVKATYKGISNTRFAQITVRNELKPNLEYYAIGNRYVFMNTTTGLYTTAKWTIGKYTSDNRDSFVVNLDDSDAAAEVTLNVSDGADTKTITVPLRKDVLNAARLKDSTDKLVLFTYPKIEDGEIHVARSDDKVFIYLGESKGDISKYTIDTDTKTDSDLNGDAADDADNIGTDSYASGAPYMIRNLGSTKERLMKVAIYDASGKQIASREIKLVLDFADENAIKQTLEGSGSTNTAISDGDKASLEKLKDLIRTKAPESERVKLMQSLSQLQDSWQDTTEKTKAVVALERSVADLSVSEDIKNEFLTLLDGFLLSESETKDEMALATSVLKKLIPNSNTHYEEIFGKDGNAGLVGEILGHPTNTELNKGIGEKILGYIKSDDNISDADKLTLKEQLRIVINGGSKNLPPSTEQTTTTDSSGIMVLILGIIKAFGYIIGFVVLGFIGLFVFFRATNRNDAMGFQDFLIEKIFHRSSGATGNAPQTVVATRVEPAAPVTTDLLGSMDTKAPETTAQTPHVFDPLRPAASLDAEKIAPVEPAQIPDWLKGTTDRLAAEKIEETPATLAPEPETPDMPSWLSPTAETPVENLAPEPAVIPETIAELPTELLETPVVSESTPSVEPAPAELPSWLSGSSIDAESAEVAASSTPIVTEYLPIAEETVETPAQTEAAPVADDLPDWLRNTNVPVTETVTPVVEESVIPQEFPISEPAITEASLAAPQPASDDLPDWLKDLQPTTPQAEPAVESKPKPKTSPKKKPTLPTTEAPILPPSTNTDDLPDWLK